MVYEEGTIDLFGTYNASYKLFEEGGSYIVDFSYGPNYFTGSVVRGWCDVFTYPKLILNTYGFKCDLYCAIRDRLQELEDEENSKQKAEKES